MKLTDQSPVAGHGRMGKNAAMNSIFNDSDAVEVVLDGTSKFKTKFVDMKSRDM